MGIVSAMMQVGAAIKHAVAALFRVTHSLRFDGSGDYLTCTLGAPTDATKTTVSVWYKRASASGVDQIIRTESGGSTPWGMIYFNSTTGTEITHYEDTGSGAQVTQFAVGSTGAAEVGVWHHIVFAIDTSLSGTNRTKMWIDGTQLSVNSGSGAPSNSLTVNGSTVHIGQNSSLIQPFDGQMAEIHLIDGQALDASYFGETRNGQWVPKEVTGLTYGNNGFYLPFDRRTEGVTLLLDGSGGGNTTITDNSSVGNTVTNVSNGVSSTNITSPYGSSMDVLSFDGTNDTLEFDVSTALQLSGDFTIETWMRRSNNASRDCVVCYWGTSGNPRFRLEFEKTTDNVTFYDGTSDRNFSYANTNADVNDTWFHLAVTRSGSTYEVFVDGTSLGTQTGTTTTFTGNASESKKGHIGSLTGTADFFGGQMADFRITRGIARDIAAGFSSGTPITNGGWDVSLTNDIQYGSLGRDATTNGNDFTVNGGITPDDQLIDSPNLRFASFDPTAVSQAGLTISEANLKVSNSATNWRGIRSDFSIPANSKAYYEWVNPTGGDITMVGVATTVPSSTSWYPGVDTNSWGAFEYSPATNTQFEYYHNGIPINFQKSGYTIPNYAIAMVAVDRVNGTIHFGIDGLWWTSTTTQGAFNGFTPSSDFSNLPTTGDLYPALGALYNSNISFAGVVNFGQDHTFAGTKSPLTSPYSDDDGNGEFYYQPPAGFKALATSY